MYLISKDVFFSNFVFLRDFFSIYFSTFRKSQEVMERNSPVDWKVRTRNMIFLFDCAERKKIMRRESGREKLGVTREIGETVRARYGIREARPRERQRDTHGKERVRVFFSISFFLSFSPFPGRAFDSDRVFPRRGRRRRRRRRRLRKRRRRRQGSPTRRSLSFQSSGARVEEKERKR